MKGNRVWACLTVGSASLLAIALLDWAAANGLVDPTPGRVSVERSGAVGQSVSAVGVYPPNNQMKGLEKGQWKLDFKFKDEDGQDHALSCSISDKDHKEIVKRQGFYPWQRAKKVNEILAKLVSEQADRFQVRENGCAVPSNLIGMDWSSPRVPAELQEWMDSEYAKARSRLRSQYVWAHDCQLPPKSSEDPEVKKLNDQLAELLSNQAKKLGIPGEPIPSQRLGIDWEWRPNATKAANFEKNKKDFLAWHKDQYEQLRDATDQQFMRERGFQWNPTEGWVLDYSILVLQSASVLKRCMMAFQNDPKDGPELLRDFLLAVPRVDVPRFVGGRDVGGFRVPTAVFIENSGDCDSKAVAFCAIRYQKRERLIIFRTFPLLENDSGVLGHALVGVEAFEESSRSAAWEGFSDYMGGTLDGRRYEHPILINNRYYWPCEVTGPGWTKYKEVPSDQTGYYLATPIQPNKGRLSS
ncbi:MAG: hypothetical protein ACJ75H_11115 [Thermoanaerobaculia bacterium]